MKKGWNLSSKMSYDIRSMKEFESKTIEKRRIVGIELQRITKRGLGSFKEGSIRKKEFA